MVSMVASGQPHELDELPCDPLVEYLTTCKCKEPSSTDSGRGYEAGTR